jgi:hypothetical protein
LKVIINQAEIERAITQYIRDTTSVSADQQITVDMIATRGADGFKATIDIADRVGAVASTTQTSEKVPASVPTPAAPTGPRSLAFGKLKLVPEAEPVPPTEV